MTNKNVLTVRGGSPREIDPATELRARWGAEIKKFRQFRGMTQTQLANAIGVTQQAVGSWENGATSPRPHIQVAVARALDVPHSALFQVEAA